MAGLDPNASLPKRDYAAKLPHNTSHKGIIVHFCTITTLGIIFDYPKSCVLDIYSHVRSSRMTTILPFYIIQKDYPKGYDPRQTSKIRIPLDVNVAPWQLVSHAPSTEPGKHKDPTSLCEKRGPRIQFMPSPWLGLTDHRKI